MKPNEAKTFAALMKITSKNYSTYLFYKRHPILRYLNQFKYDWAMDVWGDKSQLELISQLALLLKSEAKK